MATNEQLAVFAFSAYRPFEENDVTLTGWTLDGQLSLPNRGAGFDGSVFYTGNPLAPTEVVIAIRGTDGFPSIDWPLGNLPAAAGYDWGQVYRAIELVADTMAKYPTSTITVTGHSLGGGLASLVATFFGLRAHTFDTAPFELSAIGLAAVPVPMQIPPIQLFPTDLVQAFFSNYSLYQRRNGRSNQISEAFTQYRDVMDSENSADIAALFALREARVTGSYLVGEVNTLLREQLPTIIAPGPDGLQLIDAGETTLDMFELHSILLLTAMMVSSKLAQASRQQIGLAELLLDETLYARDKYSNSAGFLNQIIAQQMNGGAAPGAGILDRFSDDVLRLGTAGTSNHALMRDALIAVVIERYRFVDPADTTAFIGTAPNSVTFDTSGMLGVGRARLLDAVVTLADSEFSSGRIRTAAEGASEWRIHSGTVALVTSGTDADEVQIGSLIHSNYLRGGAGNDLLINGNAGGTLEGGENDDVLIGGTAADTLNGGAGADYIDGSGGADSLIGGAGSDELYGGAGADNYNFFLGDGSDTVFDSDGLGAIYVEGVQVQVGTRTGENTWMSSNGQLTITRLPGGGLGAINVNSLVIRDAAGTLNITVRHLDDGDLGLALNDDDYAEAGETSGDIVPPSPASTWPPPSSSSGTGSVTSYLDYTNLFGSTGIDRLFGLAGNDGLVGGDNDDYLDGGDGRDLLFGGSGRDFLSGGEGGDFIVGDGGSVTLGGQVGSQQGQVYIPLTSQVVYNGLGWGIELIGTTYLLNGATAFYAAGAADIIDAGAGDDYVWSGDGDDVIGGGDGIDTIIGGAGNDNAQGGVGNDVIIGDGQRDDGDPDSDFDYSILTAQGQDVLLGGEGNDYLVGGGNADRLYGEDGNDTLRGDHQEVWAVAPALHGDDLLDGGAGEDLLVGDGGDDTLNGGDDRDILFGDADATDLAGQYHGVDVINGDGGNDDMLGGGGADQLFGGAGDDLIFGDEDSGGAAALGAQYQGNDLIDGGAGVDTAYGGGGADRIFGGTGNDILFGDRFVGAAAHGDDYIDGGDDDDTIVGDGGADTLLGGAGADHIEGDNVASIAPLAVHGNDYIDGGSGQDTVYGWGGDDRILGGSDTDYLIGDAQIGALGATYHGADHISGGDGIDYIWGMGGNDTLFGDAGDDEIDGDDFDVTALAGNDYIDGGLGNDSMWGRGGNDVLIGGGGSDSLSGHEGDDELMGDAGNDSLNGGSGNDVLNGGDGDDFIAGGDGADTLDGGAGNDTLNGGAGDDTYLLHTGGGRDSINDVAGVNRIVFDGTVSAANLYLDIDESTSARNLVVRYSARDTLRLGSLVSIDSNIFETEHGASFSYQTQIDVGNDSDTMLGTAGSDFLYSGVDSDVLSGGAGNDSLFGGADHDTLTGGAGADLLAGGDGNDTYLFDLGDGNDMLRESGASGSLSDLDVIKFGVGISWSALSFSAASNDLIISIAGTADSITIDDWFDPLNINRIDRLLFADLSHNPIGSMGNLVSANIGSQDADVLYGDTTGNISVQGLGGNDTLSGRGANETLDGGFGDDVLDGAAGNDTLIGGRGADIYRFGRGYGRDTILNDDTDGATIDVIELAADIVPANVSLGRLGNDLLVVITGTQDTLTIRDYFAAGAVDQIRFANGTVYTPANVPAITSNLAGTMGADLLIGTAAGDSIDALAGNDEIHAGAGDDVIQGGTGVDTIFGGEGADQINDADGQGDVIFGEGGADTITADGTIDGGDGDDVLTVAGSANSVLNGGAGNDTLNGSDAGWQTIMDGGAGNDTYVVQQISGRADRITQNDTEAGKIDTVRFGAGIDPSTVILGFSWEGDLTLSSGGFSRLTISGFLLEDSNGRKIDQFLFDSSPGTVWTAAYVESLLMTPSSGSNYIRGTNGNDVIDALGDDDIVRGGAGDDTLIGGGVGQQNSDRLYGEDGNDTLIGGTASYGGAGNDVIRGSGGLLGETGNDVLEVVEGLGGNMEGGAGSDTYVINRGGVQQVQHSGIGDINADGNYLDTDPTSTDVLLFASGIQVSDVQITRAGESLTVDVYNRWGIRDRSVSVTNFFVSGNEASILDEVRFTDAPSVVWTYTDILSLVSEGTARSETVGGSSGADVLRGYAGNDLLRGNDGNDDLSGGAGNDVLWGDQGNDTYRFGHGQGYDEVYDTLGSNTIAFDVGIALSDVAFYRTSGSGHLDQNIPNGDDLVIVLNGSSEQIRVAGYYAAQSPSLIDRFTFTDGTVLTYAQASALVVNLSGTASSQTGAADDDLFIVDHRNDTVYDIDGGGIDTVESSVSFTLDYQVDNLTLTGIFNNTGEGNELNNVIRGNVGHNILRGGGFVGAMGGNADTLIGGLGDDTYYIDLLGGSDYSGYTNTNDTVVELAGEGYDTVIFSGYSLELADNIERVVLGSSYSGFSAGTVPAGIDSRPRITGNALDNVIDASAAGWSSSLVIDGGAGADEMIAGVDGQTFVIDNAGDTIRFAALGNPIGNVETYLSYQAPDFIRNITLLGSDAITATGNELNNRLDGSKNGAANVLAGGLGNDTYVIGTGDSIIESAAGGVDVVQSDASVQLQDYLENLALIGTAAANGTGNALDNQLTGNSAANILDGGAGADQMTGGAGNDTYIVDGLGDTITEGSNAGADEVQAWIAYTLGTNLENLTLLGSSNINGTGNTAVNTIRGNVGNNTLDGGAGNDTLIGGLGNDTFIVNASGDNVVENANEGVDEVRSSATVSLSANVENLTLTGTSGIGGTGNALDNVITGNTGNNSLSGGNGNDTLIGGAGSDSMSGGLGNDTFYVDVSGDTTNESASQGLDTVHSLVNRTLAANIELLFLSGTSAITGTGNSLSNLIRGNDANNTLAGGSGIDILEGGAGNDILSNTTQKSLLNGGAGVDTLTGTSANDLLIGGTGNDALTTGQGADIIVFNRGDGQDTVAASTTRDNTVSVGGGGYADLLFRKNNNDLILQVGASDQITFTGYYSATTNRSVNTLQIVIEGTSDYVPGSGDVMRDNKLETFNFEGLVAAFDQARAANPNLTSWALTNALLMQHLGGSDTAAIGGDLAYRYARFGSMADISFTPAIGILGAAGFGTSAQTLQSLASLQDASPRLS